MTRRNLEHAEQVAVMQWSSLACGAMPELRLLFAIPNGGARDAVTGKRLKDEGVKRGLPDLFLPVARCGYHGLFIEMKSINGKLSIPQHAWKFALSKEGYRTELCRSAAEAIAVLTAYVKGEA
jgi:hypothetical protein